MTQQLVTIEHIRLARQKHGGFCASGIKVWCERYGVDFRRLLQEGYPIEEIEAIGDAMSEKVVAIARGGEQ